MASKNDKLRQWAAHLYITEGYTQKGISEHIGISQVTIGKWKEADKWEEERNAILASPRKIKAVLLQELQKITNGEGSDIDADALSKVSKVIRELDGKISIELIHAVFKELDTWLSEEDPQQAVIALKYHKKFLIHKINADG